MAIIVTVEQWRSYLQHAEFVIFIDHSSLSHITDQRLHTPWQLKMYTKLAGLQYRVIYKPRNSNMAADALSHHPSPKAHLHAISLATPKWLNAVVEGYSQDPTALSLIQELTVSPDSHKPFKLQNGVLRYQGRVWIGANSALQIRIMQALHSSPLGGHSGFPVTYARVRKLFAWSGLKSSVTEFVSSCTICLQAKPEWCRYLGLLSPLPVPSESWQVISMDFIKGLPRSETTNCLMVIIDKFSKFSHFVPLHHPFSAQQIAQLFLDHIYRLHGLPTHIISDRDRIFTSTFWRELFHLAQTTLSMSSAYHPWCDGQTKRVNQCLETFLRCFVHLCPKQWSRWVTLAEY